LEHLCHHAWLHHGLRKPLNLLDVALVFSHLQAEKDSAAGNPAPYPSVLDSTLTTSTPFSSYPENPQSEIRNSQSSSTAGPSPAIPHSAFRIPHSPIGAPSRALWYTLSACRFHLGLRIPDQLLNGLRPAKVSPAEKLIHRAATRGWLPELARHLYLWFALPREERLNYLRQSILVGRNTLCPVTQGAEGCPKQ
jgi:hypothetical protein